MAIEVGIVGRVTISGGGDDLGTILAAGDGDGLEARRADRRRRRFLAGGFAVISVAVVVVVVLVCSLLKTFLLDDGDRAQGEQVLAAITLPGGWQDSSVTFRHGWQNPPGYKAWSKRLTAESNDLTANVQSLQVAMRVSGWGEATCAATAMPDQPVCIWHKGDYVITAFFRNVANEMTYRNGSPKPPACPAGWTACARIDFTLYPRAHVPPHLLACQSTPPGDSSVSGPAATSGSCERSALR